MILCNHVFLLPSATKLQRLCFYRRLSVHRGGGGVCLSACWDTTPPRADLLGADTPLEQTPPPGADTPQSRQPPRADPPEQTPPRTKYTPGTKYTPPKYGHCCGRYASYWNAFLFRINMCVLKIIFDIANENSLPPFFHNIFHFFLTWASWICTIDCS